MWDIFGAAMLWVVRLLELGGVAMIFIGSIVSTLGYFKMVLAGASADDRFRSFRASLGRSILLGLELLVAADIVRTVTVELTFESLAVLAILVLIRTFLSFALETEIEGHWPWKREPAPGEEAKSR
jgi:uncharacterized membrane protein